MDQVDSRPAAVSDVSETAGAQIMISYRVQDTGPVAKNGDGFASTLRDGLQAAGYTVFLDADHLEVRLAGMHTMLIGPRLHVLLSCGLVLLAPRTGGAYVICPIPSLGCQS